MELPRLRLHLASIATTAIQNNFDADNHSAEQTYMEDFGSLDTYMPSLYKMRIYRNCFEPCMAFDTYFEDYHIQYSNDIDGVLKLELNIRRGADPNVKKIMGSQGILPII